MSSTEKNPASQSVKPEYPGKPRAPGASDKASSSKDWQKPRDTSAEQASRNRASEQPEQSSRNRQVPRDISTEYDDTRDVSTEQEK